MKRKTIEAPHVRRSGALIDHRKPSVRLANIEREVERQVNRMEGLLPPDAPLGHGQIGLANAERIVEGYFSEALTSGAIGWRDSNNIEETLNFTAPPVTVNRRFEYAEFINAESFLSETQDDLRGIGGEFKTVEYTEAKTNGRTDNRGLRVALDLDQVADKSNWREVWTQKLVARLYRNSLRRAIALMSAAATNTAKTWDTTAGKDPDQDVETDLIAAQTASGVYPNRVLYGHTAWSKRRLAHRAQNTAGGFASAAMTPQEVASYLMADRAMVSKERFQSTAAAKAEIVNNLVLEFTANDGMTPEDPSNIKRFVSPVEGGGTLRVYERPLGAKLYEIIVEHYELIKITSTVGLRKLTIS